MCVRARVCARVGVCASVRACVCVCVRACVRVRVTLSCAPLSLQDIVKMLGLMAAGVEELSKEKPSADNVEFNAKDFIKLLDVSFPSSLPPSLTPFSCFCM